MSSTPSEPVEPNRHARELTAVLGKILDQLSLSAWMPGMALAAGVALLLVCASQTGQEGRLPIGEVANDLAGLSIGAALGFFVLVLMATVVTQAFEFEMIRLLEGYWPARGVWVSLTHRMVRRQGRRRQRLVVKQRSLEKRAFKGARLGLTTDKALRDELKILWRAQKGKVAPPGTPLSADASYLFDRWREAARPGDLRLLEAATLALSWFPSEGRLLPTMLGNTLRSHEDELTLVDGGDLRGFVLRNYERISPQLLTQMSDFRTRLNLYCALALVATLLGAISIPLLWEFYAVWRLPLLVTVASMVALSWLSYRAAVASAQSYVTALVASDEEVTRKWQLEATQPASGQGATEA